MDPELARRIAAIGTRVAPEEGAASGELFAALHEAPPYAGVSVARDLAYGPDERHRLDVFAPEHPDSGAPRAVVVFVHGGGFVRGDKRLPDSPYHDNVGLWACRAGLLGVTMTYRLAPAHVWPSGAQDVGAAVAWLREHAAAYGGDPERIVLMGSSAGAAHVAGYLALARLHSDGSPGVRGAALLSGGYDLAAFDDPGILDAYFGSDPAQREARSPLRGLVASGVPVLVGVAEHDPPVSHRQAALLCAALYDRDGRMPHVAYAAGHNHFTEVFHLGAVDSLLAEHVLAFVATHAPAREPAAAR